MLPIRLGPTELILILVIVILLFGVDRISKISGEIGTAIRQFRNGVNAGKEEQLEKKEND